MFLSGLSISLLRRQQVRNLMRNSLRTFLDSNKYQNPHEMSQVMNLCSKWGWKGFNKFNYTLGSFIMTRKQHPRDRNSSGKIGALLARFRFHSFSKLNMPPKKILENCNQGESSVKKEYAKIWQSSAEVYTATESCTAIGYGFKSSLAVIRSKAPHNHFLHIA
ncbi:hypothetical protein GH714_037050 [Hevea brasiliensis]|uniref:Uncharacterized protein n=1 Tax=Hevea brasiliensis TaxID=3981 RepID=A0A6A6MM89_HEVBR|nr:hypothetical protein GH714_037050 [Hevea brasiliensis]